MTFSARDLALAVHGSWCGTPPDQISGIFTDTRADGRGKLFVALAGERFDAHDFLDSAVASGAAAVCVQRGRAFPENVPALVVEDTLAAFQAMGAFRRMMLPDLKCCAVTGSVGKTSVKEMLRAIFSYAAGEDQVLATSGNTNNHIGVPQNLLKLQKQHRFAVLEAGMSHPGEILPLAMMIKPGCAIVNSIAPCHIEHLGSLAGIAEEKGNLFKGLSPEGTAVIPRDSDQCKILEAAAAGHRILYFGTSDSCDVRAEYCGGSIDGGRFKLHFKNAGSFEISWSLPGRHQALNAAAAAAAALSFGIAPQDICAALPRTVLPGMRSKITRINGAVFINDAYNANPASMASALDYLEEAVPEPENLILLLGGMLELGSESAQRHDDLLAAALKRFPLARMISFGKPFAEAAKKYQVEFFEDPADARETVAQLAVSGKIIFAKGSRGIGVERALPEEAK